MKKQACKYCKLFYTESECPACRGTQPVTNWKGRLEILNAEESLIAQKINVKKNGEYAIKVN